MTGLRDGMDQPFSLLDSFLTLCCHNYHNERVCLFYILKPDLTRSPRETLAPRSWKTDKAEKVLVLLGSGSPHVAFLWIDLRQELIDLYDTVSRTEDSYSDGHKIPEDSTDSF